MNPLMYTPQSFFTLPYLFPPVYTTPSGPFTWAQPFFPQGSSPWGQHIFPPPSQPLPPPFATTPSTPQTPWVPQASNSIQIAPWLIPNPFNPYLPPTRWNISERPIFAKRLTGKHIITDLKPRFDEEATFPGVSEAHIVCNIDTINRMWGSIIIRSDSTIKVWDILIGIYQFFQTRLTQSEVDLMTESDANNYERMVEAMYRRCLREPALSGRAQMEGLKRVDCLGDVTSFGGLQVVENPDNTWQLHLLLLPQ